MAEPFKNLINDEAVQRVADTLPGAWDRSAFYQQATAGLEALELKDRVVQIADALSDHLAPDFPQAVPTILAGFPEPKEHTDELMDGFVFWPVLSYIERHGLDHPELALPALRQLTSHFSAEFAIRPFFAADPDGVIARLAVWAEDSNPHVRRLVSEGSRPRLPWGIRLHDRIERPDTLLPHLTRLRDDPSEYVRRSVANHLNDIAKDHPDRVIAIAEKWAADATPTRRKLIKHALRTQIKAGDPRAYSVIGLEPFEGSVSTALSPDGIAVGGTLALTATLVSKRKQRVRLDYAVHYRKKNGSLSPKVFHWTERTLKAGETLTLTKKHTEKPVTTRRLYEGQQALDLRVNGQRAELHSFELRT